MENSEEMPSLIRRLSSNDLAGFDTVKEDSSFHDQNQPPMEAEMSNFINHQRKCSVSISMPSSPIQDHEKSTKRVLFGDGIPVSTAESGVQPKKVKFHSQPMPRGSGGPEPVDIRGFPQHPGIKKFRDKRFDSFKTWSGKLERQISNIRGKPREPEPEPERGNVQKAETESIPVARYFDALQGPELETLRPSEQIVLPEDKTWPFLLRFPISSFGICLGVSSQAIMWKTLATAPSTKFLHISLTVNLVLWCISVALVAIVASIYLVKVILFFEAVRREYYHPIRVNFFFAPWISLLFLAIGVPPSVTQHLPPALWYVLMAPILCLELKIYGQWMSGGQRRLSKVANPSNHLSVVGNFVGALLGASMGLKEGPIFFFAVGLAHYAVLFVTLYQRLPTNATLPKELHPVFFLFVAAPSVASMAWARIQGSFDYGSRIAYFTALFLYFSLAVRVNFFRGFKFSLAWWAYTFPMTGAAIATIRYSSEVDNLVTQVLVVIFAATATLTVTALLISTILHGFVLRDLFPNDIAIAISDRKPKHHSNHRRWFHIRNGSTEETENYLKFADSDCKDIEASPTSNSPGSDSNQLS
ncbi:S-type anion channel SLAH2-like [Tripterygium wilfordii]|nr:S-type anion channel SLAH2-like [Tripterygium wilfordii]